MNTGLLNFIPASSSGHTDTLIILAGMSIIGILLIIAARFDIMENRIPNALVLAGMISGLLVHSLLPAGYGFLTVVPGGVGFWASLQGLAIGGAALLPLYAFRILGAGDVKLMAAVGAILGPEDVVPAILGTFIAGGFLSFFMALYWGRARQLFRNIAGMLQIAFYKLPVSGLSAIETPAQSVGKAPYAVAIAAGTLGGVVWTVMGLS